VATAGEDDCREGVVGDEVVEGGEALVVGAGEDAVAGREVARGDGVVAEVAKGG